MDKGTSNAWKGESEQSINTENKFNHINNQQPAN